MNKFLLIFLFSVSSIFAQTTNPEWRAQKQLPVALTGHKSVMLHTGDVLIAGGLDASGTATNTSSIYSFKTGEITPTLNVLKTPRAYFSLVAVTIAGKSRVFAIGGYTGEKGNYTSVPTIEVLDFD